MPREAGLFDVTNGNVVDAFLILRSEEKKISLRIGLIALKNPEKIVNLRLGNY